MKLRLGIVLYRDHIPQILFANGEATELRDLTEDLNGFYSQIQNLKEADNGSVDLSEAVYDGVDAALEKPSWRSTKLNSRVVILIGDGNANAGYAPDPICPSYTWLRRPQCRDKDPYTRHTSTDTSNYDPDDYARDMADIAPANA